jgi:hypothetical protein
LSEGLPVNGQWSSSRSEATLFKVGVLPMDAWVINGMSKCRAAHARKMMSKMMKTMRILFAMFAVIVLP